MQKLQIAGDQHGRNTYSIPVSDHIAVAVLSGSAYAITVPAGAAHALFSSTADFYLDVTGTAVIPSASAASGSPELNPVARKVSAGDSLSLISDSAIVTVAFYA